MALRSATRNRTAGLGLSLVLALLLPCLPAAADAFTATGSGDGDVVLRFTTAAVDASIDAALDVAGVLESGNRTIRFDATGRAFGSATILLASLAAKIWILIDAVGETEDGEPLSLRGGMIITRFGGVETGETAGSGEGLFDLTVATPTLRLRTQGPAEGYASGGFVVPEIEFTMQVRGNASLELTGNVIDLMSTPHDGVEDLLDVSGWPEELADLLREFLGDSIADPPT